MLSLSSRLAAARLSGNLVDVEPDEGPENLNAAYVIQKEVTDLLSPISNSWKVGSTSLEAQKKLGTTEPGAARIPNQFRFNDSATIPVFASHDLWVESEFAVRLGVDLPPRDFPYVYTEVISAINGVAPALEFVGSRLRGGIAKSGRFNATADGGANVALCIGGVTADWEHIDLPNQRANLCVNNQEMASGLGSNALGNPINVMVWIANHLRLSTGIKAGEIVSTGTCTGLIRVAAGDQIMADFGEIGRVSAQLINAKGT